MSEIKQNQVIKQQTENVPSPVLGVLSPTPSMVWQSGGLRSQLARPRSRGLWGSRGGKPGDRVPGESWGHVRPTQATTMR